MRVFFATDVHSSEACWRKFLRAAEFYDADVLVLGGDMTGKAIVPIVPEGPGSYRTELQGQTSVFPSEELDAWKRAIRDRGLYPLVASADEVAVLRADPDRADAALRREALRTVAEWAELAEQRLPDGMRVYVCPGNDDPFEVDDVIRASSALELCEGRSVDLGDGYEMVSTGWANRTPWDTYRETDEDDLAEKLRLAIEGAGAPPERLVFNFHCPPHETVLDQAPALDENLGVSHGGRVLKHVGSTAVRDAIGDVQPILSLHGHIHEAKGVERLGRTLAVNPGSTYELGVLQGSLIELNGKKKLKGYRLTTG
jgi:Icc-related predicted phosphoesterase